MATQYSLTNSFTAITEESGTIQNIGYESVELVSTSNAVAGEGIILLPGEKKAFKGAIKARSLGATNTVNVVDFKEGVGGGDDVMTGASASADGKAGLVPTPTAGNESRFLRGDGTWAVPTDEDTQYQPATMLTDGLMSSEDKTFVEGEKENYRQPSTTYAAGQIAYHSALPTGWYLECTTAGISGSGDLTISSPAVGGTVADGTATWTIRKMESIEYRTRVIVDNAAAHNAIYRGKDLTAYFNSGEMSAAIADGSFRNIYPGDYITKSITIDGTTYSNVKFIVMDLDYHLHCGDTETTAHHVVIMPEEALGSAQMNTEHTTAGGYLGSKMWTEHMPKVTAGFEAAFGAAHILEHRELLSNAMDANLKPGGYNGWSGASSGWAWASVKVNLANENMVYGAPVLSSSFFDTGECNSQLAAFRLNHGLICSKRYWWWLRSVADSSSFCYVADFGSATGSGAATSYGVRPIALLR